jgi:hypothetical protein
MLILTTLNCRSVVIWLRWQPFVTTATCKSVYWVPFQLCTWQISVLSAISTFAHGQPTCKSVYWVPFQLCTWTTNLQISVLSAISTLHNMQISVLSAISTLHMDNQHANQCTATLHMDNQHANQCTECHFNFAHGQPTCKSLQLE